jgi:hypothetical protein
MLPHDWPLHLRDCVMWRIRTLTPAPHSALQLPKVFQAEVMQLVLSASVAQDPQGCSLQV